MAEVQYTGWGGRLGQAIVGIPVGIVLFLASFGVLFWNEGRAVHRAQALEEGKSNCVDVTDISKVNPENDKKLVHMTGEAKAEGPASDPKLDVTAPPGSLKLTRKVEIYQWQETSETKTEKKVGGGEKRTTYYYHEKEWVDKPISSSGFHADDGDHQGEAIKNVGSKPFDDEVFRAKDPRIGAYKLTDHQVDQMGAGEKLPVTSEMQASLPADLKGKLKVGADGNYYQPYDGPRAGSPEDAPGGKPAPRGDPSVDPQIGDVRVSFLAVKPATISLVYRQVGDTFEPYTAKSGSTLDMLVVGSKSSQEMFAAEEQTNAATTWILRLVGFVLMAAGIFLVLKPFATFADFLPFLGDLASAAIGLFAILVALPLTLITIALGWVFYRPLIGIPLLLLGLGLIGGTFYLVRKGRAARAEERKGDSRRGRDEEEEDEDRPRKKKRVDDDDR
jgi:hypothetical protein